MWSQTKAPPIAIAYWRLPVSANTPPTLHTQPLFPDDKRDVLIILFQLKTNMCDATRVELECFIMLFTSVHRLMQ